MIYRGSPWETGSSPRMWGTPSPSFTLLPRGRFIPTHVGNTCSTARKEPFMAVHPHACGEHKYCNDISPRYDGSSPRMWGTQAYRLIPTVIPRFIPTHVGNTKGGREDVPPGPVHPHACGEHYKFESLPEGYDGSSPRMWGTRLPIRQAPGHRRFIPTHVGNTLTLITAAMTATVHPHACGEHKIATGQLDLERGSSPRMWGTRQRHPA